MLEKLRLLIDYLIYSHMDPSKYPDALEKWFFKKTGKKLDLKNPVTFNEKIQWLKLYDRNPLKTTLVDKYLVRDWIKDKIGEEYLIELLGVWDRFDDIDFSLLPSKFVLKTNHGSGWNMVVRDKEHLDLKKAKRLFDRWMKLNFAFMEGFEMQYEHVRPKIIAEKFIETKANILFD